jgi:DNA-binding CsgD family transcriptional regulator
MEQCLGTRWSPVQPMVAHSFHALGRWDEAAAAVERAQRFELVALNEVMVECRLMALEEVRGQFESANRRAERLRLIGDSVLVISIAPVVAELALWQGQPLVAREDIRNGIRWLDATPEVWVRYIGWICGIGTRTEADIAALARARHAESDLREAREAGATFLARMRALSEEVRTGRPFYVPLAAAWLATCEAESSRLEASPRPDLWAAAATAWDVLQMPYYRGYALMREGEASLAGSGDRRHAEGALAEASAIATRLGAEPLLRAIETLQVLLVPSPKRRHSIGPDEPVGRTRYDLSPREREVLRLVAAGRSDGEIGDALFISKKTASVHVANIKGKLGAQSRVEIVTSAIGLGLVEAP